MKVWITKYALTEGIKEAHAQQDTAGRVRIVGHMSGLRLGACAHETQEAAIAHAEKMRLNRIASLKAQIAKLEKMRFTPVTDPETSRHPLGRANAKP